MRMSALLLLAWCGVLLTAGSAAQPATTTPRVLVFTKTTGFRHASIPAAIQAVEQLGTRNGFEVDATEDAAAFTDSSLARYDAVLFLMTTGDVLDDGQQAAFERYIRAGGGFVGVHSAADTEYDWPWYGGLLGTHFASHPAIQSATIDVASPRDPSTADLPARWTRTDEWYNFSSNPRGSVHVLATLDETTYSPGEGAMGADHPIAWSHAYDGGRAWYTGGGHTDESYSEPLFLGHLLGGIRYAMGTPESAPAQPKAKPRPPAVLGLKTSVESRRVVVTVRTNCSRCSARLRIAVAGRTRSAKLAVEGAVARGRSPVLPLGRWRLSVTLSDGTTGLRKTASRWVVVR
jgi:type 1 glutamine amidotransferase